MIPTGVAAAVVVGGTAAVRINASASPIDTYRTTTVTTGSVEQRLDLTGSVHRVNQVSQGFALTGTVSSVSVVVGDTVKAGQALASLDPGPLASATTDAQAALAQAKAALESDQTSTTTAATPAAVTRPTTGSSTGTTRVTTVAQVSTPTTSPRATTSSGRSSTGKDPRLEKAQKDLTSAQNTVTRDLKDVSDALTLCRNLLGPTPTTPPTTTSTTSPTATTPPVSSTPTMSEADKGCLDAIATAPPLDQINKDQGSLTRSQANLTAAVALAITTARNTAKASGTTSPSGSASQPATNQSSSNQSSSNQSASNQSASNQSATSRSATSQSSSGPSSGSGQSAAARIVSDQAAVTNAEATLSSAIADQASATLKSSIAGTVGSVSLVAGTSSTGKNVTIVGSGAVQVTVNVPLASMAAVHVGQKANVTPQGATSSVPGAVTSISLLPAATTTGSGTGAGTGTGQSTTAASTPVYPAVVLVPDALPALASGSRANVSLLIGTANHVLTIANSALTPLGNGQALALTFKNGVATRALVKTGYAGTLSTQVASGLTAGQQVVLADLSTALPTNTTNARRFGVGGGAAGGLGGAGLGGAGLGGAGLGGGAIPGGGGFPARG